MQYTISVSYNTAVYGIVGNCGYSHGCLLPSLSLPSRVTPRDLLRHHLPSQHFVSFLFFASFLLSLNLFLKLFKQYK